MKRPKILVVDGYNFAHRTPAFRKMLDINLESTRNAIVRYCSERRISCGDYSDVYVVFDGNSSICRSGDDLLNGCVRVIYTRTGETADERIVKIVNERRETCAFCVVSDDVEVIRQTRTLGAKPMSVREFGEKIKRGKSSKACEGDKTGLSASDREMITESLRRIWTDNDK